MFRFFLFLFAVLFLVTGALMWSWWEFEPFGLRAQVVASHKVKYIQVNDEERESLRLQVESLLPVDGAFPQSKRGRSQLFLSIENSLERKTLFSDDKK